MDGQPLGFKKDRIADLWAEDTGFAGRTTKHPGAVGVARVWDGEDRSSWSLVCCRGRRGRTRGKDSTKLKKNVVVAVSKSLGGDDGQQGFGEIFTWGLRSEEQPSRKRERRSVDCGRAGRERHGRVGMLASTEGCCSRPDKMKTRALLKIMRMKAAGKRKLRGQRKSFCGLEIDRVRPDCGQMARVKGVAAAGGGNFARWELAPFEGEEEKQKGDGFGEATHEGGSNG